MSLWLSLPVVILQVSLHQRRQRKLQRRLQRRQLTNFQSNIEGGASMGHMPLALSSRCFPFPYFVWPFPIKQFEGDRCAFAACFNAGIDVTEEEFPMPLMSLKDMVCAIANRPGSRWKLPKRQGPAAKGTFVLSAHAHCFTVFDGWYLDADRRFPHPVREAQLLGILAIDVCYEVQKRW